MSSEISVIKQKREQFQVQIRKQRIEELFRRKRISVFKTELPFATKQIPQLPEIQSAFQQAQHMAIQNYDYIPGRDWPQWVYHMQMLNRHLETNDCDENYDTYQDVQLAFHLLNKGLPIIDRTCLSVLKAFTIPNHYTCKPILEHMPELVEIYQSSEFGEIQLACLNIFRNLAADCYICRDRVIMYDIPQIVFNSLNENNPIYEQLLEEFTEMLVNLSCNKPDLSEEKVIQLSEIVHQVFLLNRDPTIQAQLLFFIRKIYKVDKSRISPDVISIISTMKLPIPAQQDAIQIYGCVSLLNKNDQLNLPPMIINSIVSMIDESLISYSKDRQKLIEKCCVTLENFVLDGKINTTILLGTAFIKLMINLPEQLYDTPQLYSLLLRMCQTCSDQELNLFKEKLTIRLTEILQLQLGLETAFNILETVGVIIYRTRDMSQVFQDANGYAAITEWAKHQSNDIYEACERIFELIES